MSIRPLVQEDGVVREMNDVEYDIHLQAVSNEQAQAAAVAAKEAARQSAIDKLAALGLTVDEISAAFGLENN
jgi:hypothetical protein